MAKKVNYDNVLKSLIATWYEGYDLVSETYLENLGLDTDVSTFEIGNFRLEKRFFSLITKDYTLSLIDWSKDLMNESIKDNVSLIKLIMESFDEGYGAISFKTLAKYKFNIRLTQFDFSKCWSNRNFILSRYESGFYIIIRDKERDIEGRYISGAINIDRVIAPIIEYKISANYLSENKEVDINEDLVKHLQNYFVPVKKSTGNSSKYFDVVIGKDDVVIEIKLARELLKSGNYQRAIGQIEDYTDQLGKKDNLLFLIIGNKEEKSERNIKLIEEKISKDMRCRFMYKIAK